MKEVIMYNHLWFINKKESLIWHAHTRIGRHCDTPTHHVSHIFNIIYKLMWTYHNELLSVTLRGKKSFQAKLPSSKLFFLFFWPFIQGLVQTILIVVADFHALKVDLVFQKNWNYLEHIYNVTYGVE